MAIFGTRTSRPVHWLQTGLVEARRVGRIHSKDGRVISTGFLFDGALVGDEFKSLPLFLTCNHCVAGARSEGPGIPWSEAAIVFQQMQTDPSTKGEAGFLQSLSESPVSALNYTLLLLDRWPGAVNELKLAPKQPSSDDRVFVISYPQGGGLSVSLDDNAVLDPPDAAAAPLPSTARESLMHYRAPTEPGSSGAPVFNEHWEIVAVHIGNARKVSNYGVRIDAVVEHAQERLAGLSIPGVIRESITRHDNVSPSILQEAQSYFSVFISYRREDAPFARRLYHAFEASGVRAWLDERSIVPGQFIDDAIQKGIAAADRFVLCCSRASLENSWWVDSEVTSIFEKERQLSEAAKRKLSVVIPVMLDDYLTDEWKGPKAPELRSRLATDFKQWQDEKHFAASFEMLLRALRTQGG
jgi:hypothetical protein